MKKQLLFLLLTCSALSLTAQDNKVMKDFYSFNGGLLGAANFTTLNAEEPNTGLEPDFGTELGWSVGGWFNFPIGKVFAIEPQYQLTSYTYDDPSDGPNPFMRGAALYHSIPINLKVHIGKLLAITAGPQFDFVMDANDKNGNYTEGDITKASISASGGLELWPRGRFTVFGRYVYGFTDINNARELGNTWEFTQSNIQAGLKVRVFGGLVKADRDGDGIPDEGDKCPDVFGLERYMGCPIPDTDGDAINDELDECPQIAGVAKYNGCPVPDRDMDGVNDEMDKCPDLKGSPKYGGCPIPDTDGDGVNDDEDKCPTVIGMAKYNGCPIPDTDGDGVNDENDRCPSVAGLPRYNGCPIPDSDGDGVNDEEDRCPTIAGIVSMRGCPKIESFDAHEVTFATGSSSLTTNGKKELDLVADYLKANPSVKVRLDGHTDNTGSAKVNDKLALDRANAALSYLASKGIAKDRMEAFGHGSNEPAFENDTAAGRQKNRRVEVTPQ